jgi:hypothetical protein
MNQREQVAVDVLRSNHVRGTEYPDVQGDTGDTEHTNTLRGQNAEF